MFFDDDSAAALEVDDGGGDIDLDWKGGSSCWAPLASSNLARFTRPCLVRLRKTG